MPAPLVMKPDKVVLDTNIWVSYFLMRQSAALVRIVLDHDLTVFSSPILISELSDVLYRKKIAKYLTLPVEEYVNIHLEIVQIIHTTPRFSQAPDPKDNFLFDLALQTNSQLIVSGDKTLLAFQDRSPVRMATFSEFKAFFST